MFIGEDNHILYFYTRQAVIVGIDDVEGKLMYETETGLPKGAANHIYSPDISSNIINHKVALFINYNFYLWDLQNRRLLRRSAVFPDASRYLLTMKTEDEVFYFSYKTNNALQVYNFSTAASQPIFVKGKDNKEIARCVIYRWQNKPLLTFSNQLFEVDTALRVLKSEIMNLQNKPIGGGSAITKLKEDNFGNLYVISIMDGFTKIMRNNYPVNYYGTTKKEDNFVLSILPDKSNNRIMVGTTNGLLVFDTLQRLLQQIRTFGSETVPIAPNTILKNSDGHYFLYGSGKKEVTVLDRDLRKIRLIPVTTTQPENKKGFDYFGNVLTQEKAWAVTQTQGKLFKTDFVANTVTQHEFTSYYTMSGMLSDGVILAHANDELIFLNAATFKEVKRLPFKNTGDVRCFVKDARNNIYLGTNKGIFKIDLAGNVTRHLNKETGLPDECIYAMALDTDGFLWCSTNKGILRVNDGNGIFQLTKEDGLQENEFNTNVVATAEDNEVFFGGVNGVSSFYPSALNRFEEKINLLFTRIKLNNDDVLTERAVWNLEKLDLSYTQNSLAFDFVAMGNSNPRQYIYQYRMKGIEEHWMQNIGLQTVRYFLPPGKYVFQVFASRFLNGKTRPMKEIYITIHPPFWKAWWFITSVAVSFIAAIVFFLNQQNRRTYRTRLVALEHEYALQVERERISRDLHDSIGAYANAVLYSTERLQQEEEATERTELMMDLKFASKDIITSLRETIWALKKEQYSGEECLLRMKNFVYALSRYYPHIHFKVEGSAPADTALHYSKALNVVRILQESVTNAIKHGAPHNVVIISTENEGRWQLKVTDDGKGFNLAADNGTGNGLHNMKHRAIESGLYLSISSEQGGETTVLLLV
jgi:signal transduction histidine kinase